MKKRKIIISVLFVFFVAVAGVAGYFVHSQKVHAVVSNQEIVLEEGQELLYAKITSISGNEMDYTVLEAQTIDIEEMGNGRGRNGAAQDTGRRSSDGEMPSGGGVLSGSGPSSNGEMLSGGGPSSNGEMPSGGGQPSGGGSSFNGEMPSGNQNGNMTDSAASPNEQSRKSSREKSNADTQNRTMTTYTETGKTGQIQIPVGTDVETKLGTITTFSRLSNGDTIRMLMQKSDNGGEDLLKIWIVE